MSDLHPECQPGAEVQVGPLDMMHAALSVPSFSPERSRFGKNMPLLNSTFKCSVRDHEALKRDARVLTPQSRSNRSKCPYTIAMTTPDDANSRRMSEGKV